MYLLKNRICTFSFITSNESGTGAGRRYDILFLPHSSSASESSAGITNSRKPAMSEASINPNPKLGDIDRN
jgi:hypothetical protein